MSLWALARGEQSELCRLLPHPHWTYMLLYHRVLSPAFKTARTAAQDAPVSFDRLYFTVFDVQEEFSKYRHGSC